jgi:hypothetical protein
MHSNLNSFVRISGLIHIIAGALLAVAYLSHHHVMTPETIGSTTWFLVHLAFIGSLLGGIFGVSGLYFGHIEQIGKIGHAGFVMAISGLFLIGGLAYFETFVAPSLAHEFPAVIEKYGAADGMGAVALMFPISGALTVLGYALLAGSLLPVIKSSRLALIAVIVTAIVFGFGLSPFGGLHLAMMGGSVFGISLMWIGLSIMIKGHQS